MGIIGSIVKVAVDVKEAITTEIEPKEAQLSVLKSLLETAANTNFGKEYKFDDILGSDDIISAFQRQVPVFDYNKMHDSWWKLTIDGHKDISWPGSPDYFALSSGTTGSTSKRIPVTNEMLDSIKRTGVKQFTSLSQFNLPAEFFEKDFLMLGSSTDLTEKDDHLEGEISGISASNIPFWFRGFYKPGEEIAQVDDWDERVKLIVEQAKDWDVGGLSGIPAWIELMLKAVIDHYGLNNIHELWPNLQVYTSGGVAFAPYEKSFDKLFGKHVHVIDTYLASEGFIAFQSRPATDSMQLDVDNGIFYEFAEFNPDNIDDDGMLTDRASVVSIGDVQENTDYVLIISTVSGTWRYIIGDTVQFTDKSKSEIRITGRTKHFLNTVGSQLSVSKMNDGMKHLEDVFGVVLPEFTVSAVLKNGEYIHRWYLGLEQERPELSEEKMAKSLDDFLKSVNKNYNVARGKALGSTEVKLVPYSKFHEWSEKSKKKGGQIKVKRVMKPEEFQDWEKFISQ